MLVFKFCLRGRNGEGFTSGFHVQVARKMCNLGFKRIITYIRPYCIPFLFSFHITISGNIGSAYSLK